ncbi:MULTISPECIES: pyridoxal phosphate-dependent aminotransferase [Pseudoalteromonas]|uniref:pyridoxal phosphate-dependent aminotransferase n=1 Tax=Pseudoalteromonas TaxID=53246 RepID=UPI000FFEFD77|nr:MULTISPECIES: pyridoxal phosphate-dependent aminotransferase [Pseudoalteromonas]NKC19128.1 aminotransferase class I/II-fold pyridoxal phosphate-dependent enzyme [Pseudoalteromonas galatheae]RXE87286.1 pyridoxal phosphate-dependent aminotransferase [Pseudoalteromonas sp. A757]
MRNSVFSDSALALRDSITHGTKAKIAAINASSNQQVIDLSIGTLDDTADTRIDQAVINFINENARAIHEFAPVTGFEFLRDAISDRVFRLRGLRYAAADEVMVTPGGIKGAITVAFHTLLNPDDEVIVPLPNWPHYADMIALHGAKMVPVLVEEFYEKGLQPAQLEAAINDNTKMVILGDCVNPSGKIYSYKEQCKLADVIAKHNIERAKCAKPAIQILFDCPYESHILDGPDTISAYTFTDKDHTQYSLRDCTTFVTGPGKTYGMHGDRAGYICAPANLINMMARVQVNLNSFAATYAQIATNEAMQAYMDDVAHQRAVNSRANLQNYTDLLNAIDGVVAPVPQGGFFIFVDLSAYGEKIQAAGYDTAAAFLLEKAKVASIGGMHFAEGSEALRHFVRMNCGRARETLEQAAQRIQQALESL